MFICAAGDIHGALDRMYADILAFEETLSRRFDWVLHVGDFGIWPDPKKVDRATAKHDGAGDFPRWVQEHKSAPRKTLFIKGNHEDFDWLAAQRGSEVLPNLHYLRNGHVFEITANGEALGVGGIGGCFGPSNYQRASANLYGSARRHYARDEIEKLFNVGGLDVIMTHDAPAGVRFERALKQGGFLSEAVGLDELLARTQPRVCFFGHHHVRLDSEVGGVPCIGLNKVAMSGNLVAIEMTPQGREYSVLGEWPKTSTSHFHEPK